jgi:hypothetical protein
MTVRSLLALLTILAVPAVVTGCGAAAVGSEPASLAPAGAKALAEIDGDLDSDQWQAARDLVGRFPDGGKLLDKLGEVEGAVGAQVVVVALNEGQGVALTQPDDEAKLGSFAKEYHLVSREIEGWTAVAEDAETLDAYERALEQGTLEGNAIYEEARAKFPDEALATLYTRGDTTSDWTALALTAEEDGFRLAGRARMGTTALTPLDPALLDEIPGDVLAAFAFGGGDLASQLPENFAFSDLLTPFADALSGGAVVWVRPGMPIPEVTAILPNGDSALLDQFALAFTGSTPGDAELDGHIARRIHAGPVTITYADVDGRLVLTTGATLQGGSGTLADEPGFQDVREQAGSPDDTGGFVYVDVSSVSTLLSLLGGLDVAGIPEELTRNLQHVRSVYAALGGEGPEQEIAIFVAIG